MKSFFIVVKHIKDCSKARNNGALGKFTLKNLINLQFLAISLNFFCFYLKNFPSWIRIRIQYADPVPGDKMNADPCGSGSTALPTILQYMSIVLS